MKFFAPLLVIISVAMACFTDPRGLGVWVAPSEIVSVSHATACAPNAKSEIKTNSGTLCVQETPQEVLKVLEGAK